MLRTACAHNYATTYSIYHKKYCVQNKKGVINVVLEWMSKRILDEKGMKGSMKYVQEQMYEKWKEG